MYLLCIINVYRCVSVCVFLEYFIKPIPKKYFHTFSISRFTFDRIKGNLHASLYIYIVNLLFINCYS